MPEITSRPAKPEVLMFKSKGLLARAKVDSLSFGVAQNGSIQMALDYEITLGGDGQPQRAEIYSAPKDVPIKEGQFAPIPPGTRVRLYGSFSGGAKEFTIDKLRASGWRGNSLKELSQGKFEGLGETDVRVTVDVDELDQKGGWRMVGEGDKARFMPRMQVGFVNRVGQAFKELASIDALAELDKNLGDLLDPSHVRSSTPAAARPAASSSSPVGAPSPDEDIPF